MFASLKYIPLRYQTKVILHIPVATYRNDVHSSAELREYAVYIITFFYLTPIQFSTTLGADLMSSQFKACMSLRPDKKLMLETRLICLAASSTSNAR